MLKKDSNCFVLCHKNQGGLVYKYVKSKRKFIFGETSDHLQENNVCTGKMIVLFVSNNIPDVKYC